MTKQTLPVGKLYEVDGRRLMLHRAGSGGPSVVFLPGAGLVGLDFLNIQQLAADRGTSVLYDRAGTGWSDDAELPRSADQVTTELHDLLRAADIPGPYVLVGHSLAGSHARRYAQRFPDEVAGLVLLDPYHEDNTIRMPAAVIIMQEQLQDQPMPELTEEVVQFYRGLFEHKLAEWPADLRAALIDYHVAHAETGVIETANLDAIGDEVRTGGAEPDVPVIVLSAMGVDTFQAAALPEDLERQVAAVKRELHAELAGSFPRGEQRILDDAGHNWIHVERADAVLAAIEDVIEATR